MTPQLRFPGFTDEWQVKKLGDIFSYKNGGAFENYLAENGKYKLITLNSIDINGRLKHDHKKVKEADWYLQKNDLVMVLSDVAHGNFLGLTDIIPVDNQYVLNQRMGMLRRRDKDYNLLFLRTYININQKYFKLHGQGSSQQNLAKGDILNFRIIAPSKSEQEKIAGFMGAVDDKVAAIQNKVTAMHEYKKGVMQALFSGKLRFRDENGNPYPAWEYKQLGDVFDGLKGSGLSLGQVIESGKNKCILYGELYTKYPEKVTDVISSTNSTAGVRSKRNDLLLPCSTTTTGIDLANATALDEENVLLGGDIAILRFKNKGSNLFYAYYLTHFLKHMLAAYGQGSTIVHMYYSHYKKMIVAEPSLEEQKKIADFLGAIDAKIELENKKLQQAKQFKKSLLQRMFV